MRKATAAAGSLAHFVLQPGVVAGLVPWWPRRHSWQPGQANQPARHQT
jgi:hypothetical protein